MVTTFPFLVNVVTVLNESIVHYRSQSKKERHAKIENELQEILGANAKNSHAKKASPPKPKLLQDALKEQQQDRAKAAKAKAAQLAKQSAKAPPKHMVVAKRGHQVLSRSAERSLVAFLSQADSMSSRKLSPDQVALGRELRQARAKEAVAGKKGAAPKAAAAHAK
mmetsp:Transcript_21832/g.59815  ORF Transcript_21832/g.59815 Transcript_21832/m.59815 type:complete len:166 (-) Transcript_21832:36-533(-)